MQLWGARVIVWNSERPPHHCFLWKRLQQKHTLLRPGPPSREVRVTGSPWNVFFTMLLATFIARTVEFPTRHVFALLPDTPAWRVVPWLLIGVLWVALFRFMRRAPPSS